MPSKCLVTCLIAADGQEANIASSGTADSYLKEADFKLHLESLAQIVPHLTTPIMLPIHLRDMVTLAEKHPAVHQEFLSGE